MWKKQSKGRWWGKKNRYGAVDGHVRSGIDSHQQLTGGGPGRKQHEGRKKKKTRRCVAAGWRWWCLSFVRFVPARRGFFFFFVQVERTPQDMPGMESRCSILLHARAGWKSEPRAPSSAEILSHGRERECRPFF